MTTDSTAAIPLASPAAAAVFAALISRRSAAREELARSTGRPAKPLDPSTDQQVWVAPYRGGYVVALFNLGDAAATVSVEWSELGEPGRARVRDVWAHRSLGTSTGFAAELPAHGSRLLLVTPT